MEGEALEQRYSPAELKRLRRKLEVSRESLVPAAVREAGLRKRQVTVGRTSLGECLRQLEELEKEAEGVPEGPAQEGLLLNRLEKGLRLIERIEFLREREAQRKKRKRQKALGPRLEAAKQDGRGGKNKTVPPRRREGLTGGPQEEKEQPQSLAPEETLPEEDGREGPDPRKREAGGERGSEGEDEDSGDDEGGRDHGNGQVLPNLSEKSPVHIDRISLLRERKPERKKRKKKSLRPLRLEAAKQDGRGGNGKTVPPRQSEGLIGSPQEEKQQAQKKKRKRKKALGPRLEAAKQDGRGGNNKTVSPRQSKGLTGGPQEEQHQPQHLAPEETLPEEDGREGPDPQKREADGERGSEGEDEDSGDDEGGRDHGNGQVLPNLSEKSPVHIDRISLLRERKPERKKRKKKSLRPLRLEAAKQDGRGGNGKTVPPRQSEGLIGSPQEEKQQAQKKKRKRKKALGPRLEAAKQDGRGGNNKTVSPRQSKGLTGGPQEEQHQPQHLAPEETLPEEDGREGPDPQKREADGERGSEGEDEDSGDDEGGRDHGNGQVLLNLSANSPVHIDGLKLLRERKSERKKRKMKKKPPRPVAAKQDRSGGNHKTIPPSRSEGLTGSPQGEKQQPPPLAPEETLPEEDGREGPDPRKREADGERGSEGEDEDSGDDEGGRDHGNGQVLLNLSANSPVHIDGLKLLRERKSERKKRKMKKKPPRPVAAKQDRSGGNHKTIPPSRSEGLTGSPQGEKQQPPPLAPEETLPEEDGREGPDPRKREADGERGSEGEDEDHGGDESDEDSKNGQVLLNFSEKSPVRIDRFKPLRERNSERKKKSLRPLRLLAAKQDGSGDNGKTVPPRQSEGLIDGPQEEKQQLQHPPQASEETLPEEDGREDSDLQKNDMEVDQQPDHEGEDHNDGDDEGDQGRGVDSDEDGSECSNNDEEASDPQKSEAVDVDRWPGGEGEAQDCGGEEGDKENEDVCSNEGDHEHSDDYDEESETEFFEIDLNDKSAMCDDLWADLDELEQKVDVMQNVSQEELDALYVKRRDFSGMFRDILRELKSDLERTVIPLWSAVWNAPLRAVMALQEALNRPLAVELTALKKESDSLSGFLQTIKSHDTLAKLSMLPCSLNALQNFQLIKMGLPYGVPLKGGDALKQRRDPWYSTLLHILLKQGQEMVGALQEKVDALQNTSLKQVDILKVKTGAVQKQMGALWKVPLKEMMILLAVVYELLSALVCNPSDSEEMNTPWKEARDQVFTLKTCKGDAFQELHPLWEKLDALQDAICRIPIKKLMVLKEKEKALHGKVATLQNNLWNSLEKELQLLKDKLYSLRDPSLKELEEELDELQSTLDKLRYDWDYPLQEKVGTLQKEMDALQKKIDARQKTNAPLKEVEEVMEMERSSFSETLKAPEAGAEEINVHGRITDQPANIVAKMAVPSSFEATKNAGRSSGSTGNLRGSVSTSVPSSSAGVRKVWHGEVTLEERHRLVYKFAEAISPGNDSVAAREKLVAYTKQIEEDMFELANSKVEYHDLVAGKLDAIQKKLDQNLRSSLPNQGTSNDQPDLQASWTHPGNIPRVAATAGQEQPLILPRGSQWDHTSASSVQTSQPQIASSVPSSVNHPVQMNNVASVSVGQVSGAVLPSSLNTLEHQNSHLPCIPVTQPSIHYPLPSPSTVVGLPPTQCQQPLGMTPLPSQAPALLSIPASLSELHPTPVAGSVPDALHVQGTPWEETSNGSTLPSPNGASDTRMVPTSADPTTTPPCSSGSQPAAGKRPFSGVEAAEKASVALPIPETTNLNRSKTQDPQQPEEAMCAESSEDSFADCEPTLTETEPPHKKQKVDPVERIQMATLAQELYAAHQKYVKYVTDTVTQNMEKVGDLMGRLHGPPKQNSALKDIEDAKALTSALKKALALLKCFLEDS